MVCLRQRVSPTIRSNFTDEAHIQHADGFIDDQDFDGSAIEAFGFDVFHQSPGVATMRCRWSRSARQLFIDRRHR